METGDDEVWAPGTKEMLDDMHKRKIDMADEIYVINVGGYIGESTRSEIEYATKNRRETLCCNVRIMLIFTLRDRFRRCS